MVGLCAVSYTHLDVYKRQEFNTGVRIIIVLLELSRYFYHHLEFFNFIAHYQEIIT